MVTLTSARGETLPSIPWNRYPRPRLRRDSFVNLNGQWELAAGGKGWKITVPFCPESALSGVGIHFPEGELLTFRRSFPAPQAAPGERVLLHIGAADQRCKVVVNGAVAGTHEGGYDHFCLEITDFLKAENVLEIQCWDDLNDRSYPWGKQSQNRGGMWYTPVSGLWQTVWLEVVPRVYVERLDIQTDGSEARVSVCPVCSGTVTVEGVGRFPLREGRAVIPVDRPRLWSPEDPYLYEITVEVGEDRVESYFALRTLEIRKVGKYPRLCLNGKPYFFHGLLDQGYWPEGLLTPPDPECYRDDILAMKKLGFNTLRKHIKVEPEEFYYQCDRLGMIVWQDMVNNGSYSFLRDTALPTVGLQKMDDRLLNRNPEARARFRQSMETTVEQLKNHPSICLWTIFNEGWGQFESSENYRHLKALDPSRWIDTTSGWFRGRGTDVDSRHVYFRKVKLRGDGKKPLILSEFGGRVCALPGHVMNPDKVYGYGSCQDLDELNREVERLYRQEILPAIPRGLCAAIYTQVSDVEDELNGALTYDRRVEKLHPKTMFPIAREMEKAIREE